MAATRKSWAGVHSSQRMTGTSVIPSLRAALRRKWRASAPRWLHWNRYDAGSVHP
jgi:hypothetical protein